MERSLIKKELDTTEWSLVNEKSGEVRKAKGKLTESYPKKCGQVHSKTYLYLDIDRLKILHSYGVSQVELGFLQLISTNLMSFHNICLDDQGKAHTPDTIAAWTGESRQNAKIKLDSLVEKNILAFVTYPDLKQFKKVYAVNPHILRKGKDQSEFLFIIFKDFAKKDNPKLGSIEGAFI